MKGQEKCNPRRLTSPPFRLRRIAACELLGQVRPRRARPQAPAIYPSAAIPWSIASALAVTSGPWESAAAASSSPPTFHIRAEIGTGLASSHCAGMGFANVTGVRRMHRAARNGRVVPPRSVDRQGTRHAASDAGGLAAALRRRFALMRSPGRQARPAESIAPVAYGLGRVAAARATRRTKEPAMSPRPDERSSLSDPPIPDQPTIPDAPSPGTPDVPDIGSPEPEPDQQPGRTGD